MTERDGNNPFALQKYFVSFYDQKLQTADMEGLIICTNSDIDENARDIWQAVDVNASTSSSTSSLDSYISSLFAKVGGKCYQLDYDKLKDGKLNKLYELFKQCTKRGRLVKLLVNAIKSKEKITRRNVLFKEYRLAILDIIDKQSISTNGSYGFTKEFLDLSSPNATPGYEAFRKEFDEQCQQELINSSSSKDSSGLENLKLKRVFVAKDFFSDFKNDVILPEIFPDDKDDESKLKTFCERFRFVCATKSEHEVDELILEFWRDLVSHDDQRKGAVEENVAIEKLFKTNFNWLMNPFAKPLHSDDIQKDLDNIKNTLAHIKLKGASEKLRKQVMGTSFRINPDALRNSELYEQVKNETILEIEACDMQFAGALLIDILSLDGKDLHNTLLLEDAAFTDDSKTVEEVFRSAEHSIHLIIFCDQAFKTVQSIIRRWRKDTLKDTSKHVFLIRKVSDTPSELNCFTISDVSEDSWKQFLDENISICTTSLSPAKLFQHTSPLSIEAFIKLLDWGKQMETDNNIEKNYRLIKNSYVQRYWIEQKRELKAENLDRDDYIEIYSRIHDIYKIQKNVLSFAEITEQMKKYSKFDKIFTETPNRLGDDEPIIENKANKLLVLLGESGFGKSTNLTWLAWHMRKRYPTSWVVRCNLSDHCTDFQPFRKRSLNQDGTVINKNEALIMLHELIHLSLVDMSNVDLQTVRLNARKCSECLVLSNGQVKLDEKLMERHGLSLKNSILLRVFAEKFNAGELILFLDGFDEIAPHYKEVVLQFLSLFAQFDGVRKLYLTSRPYSFKQQFGESFKKLAFFQLEPLLLHDKATMLHKMMKSKMQEEHIDNDVSDFCKALCVTLIFSLDEMSDIPLNLMMSVDILTRLSDRYINIAAKTASINLFNVTSGMSKPWFIVQNFVDIKINLICCKLGANLNASDNPILIDKFSKLIETVTRQHELLSLFVLFDKNELKQILSNIEIDEATTYMEEIREAREKTGIIHGILDDIPLFIHRTFAEYFAGLWIIKRQTNSEQNDKINISGLESFWKHNDLRMNIDRVLAQNYPLHVAIIDGSTKLHSLFSANPEALNMRDDGNRTPLYLMASYKSYQRNMKLLPQSIDSDIVNQKENILGWTALDCTFYSHFRSLKGNSYDSQFAYYLLKNGASINADVLYAQVVSSLPVKVRQAAAYAKFVMQYLSQLGFQYESSDTAKTMKQFCDKVAEYVINETSTSFGQSELTVGEKSILKDIITEDSVWMLESITKRLGNPEHVNLVIRKTLQKALKEKRVCVLKHILANNPSLLTEQIFQECIAMSVVGDYKNEFKSFVDVYCRSIDMKNFQASPNYKIDQSNSLFCLLGVNEEEILKIFQMNDVITDNIKMTNYNPSPAIEIDKNILSVLITCVVSAQPFMLGYLKESCKLKLCPSLVYYLARVTDCFVKESEENYKRGVKLDLLQSAYKCLLAQASNISDVEVKGMLCLAITSGLFSFSKCLIERYKIGLQTVDELNDWNALQVCVSRPRSNDVDVEESMFGLFRFLLNGREMDCFGTVGHSILYFTIANGHENILNFIIARKLGLNQLKDIESLGVDAIPNLTFCYRAIYEVSNSVGENGCYHQVLCMVAKQIANISSTIHTELNQESNSGHLLLQENAQVLYPVAMKCKSLFLMYYLHREFSCTLPASIDGAEWLAWIEMSLYSSEFRLFQWIVRQYCVAHHVSFPIENDGNEHIACDVVKEFDDDKYDPKHINIEGLVKQTEAKLSHYKSKEEVCILKLVVLTVSLGNELGTKYLCETLSVIMTQKVLFDIIEIAHKIGRLNFRSKCSPSLEAIYKYLFGKLLETDAENRNMLHLASDSGLNCLVNWLLKQNFIKATLTNNKDMCNFLHYYSSCNPEMHYCDISQLNLFRDILHGVLEYDHITIEGTTQGRDQKLKEICFNNNEGRKSVIDVAIAVGAIKKVEYIIKLRLGIGIGNIDKHIIWNEDECSRFRDSFDVVDQIAAHLPFNVETEELLDSIARSIDSFRYKKIKHITQEANVEAHIVKEACHAAVKYRSVSTLEHLIMVRKSQMVQSLATSTSRELYACMMECIRQDRTNLFRVLLGHYRTVQGILPSTKVEYEEELNDGKVNATTQRYMIRWSVAHQMSQGVTTKQEYLPLLILSSAYGRLSMTKSLVLMLQLVVSKQLILLLIKTAIYIRNDEHRVSVYEYLSSVSERNINLLHLCAQSGDEKMVKYLIKHKLLDPYEVDLQNRWNAGHYSVSERNCDFEGLWNAIYTFQCLMEDSNMDCFAAFDLCGRNVLHLAMENGHTEVVEYIIKHRLNIFPLRRPGSAIDTELYDELYNAWNLAKVNECIDELQRMKPFLPDNRKLLYVIQTLTNRRKFLMSFAQAFHTFPLHTN
ncbi:uncharacterized protein LOC125954240 [Anopheles darlingi]|uniref:uncharacterized protein LOC125954240 n=1 Tax=Anopheles darlingi TaxID=43151 RepID=UPI0021002F68|nr:uncharacterized protein LOC125954240 [Anopheles darlingi]XP_049540331.1 uncharacterized protein LOC125954240 [Anopheles darlingi]